MFKLKIFLSKIHIFPLQTLKTEARKMLIPSYMLKVPAEYEKVRFLRDCWFLLQMQNSFERLVQEYTPMIYHMMKKLHIYKDRDQYYQLGLIALWEATEKYDEKKGKFSSLAYSTIRGKLLDYLKRESHYCEKFIPSNSLYLFEAIDEGLPIPLERDILLSYCNHLSDKQLRWVIATFIENKTISQIASEEGVNEKAIRKWRDHALLQMRKNRRYV